MYKGIEFKKENGIFDLPKISPLLLMVMGDVALFCCENDLQMLITSILRPETDGISKSSTHQTGRAFDLSIKNWPQKKIRQLEQRINEKFSDIGAISSQTGKSRPIYIHGPVIHAHFQVRRLDHGYPSRT